MPNLFAELVLYGWPLIALVAFWRLPPATAVAAAIVGGYLLLPNRVFLNFPMLPTVEKDLVAAVAGAIVGVVSLARARNAGAQVRVLPGWIPGDPWIRAALVILFLGILGTSLTNNDTLRYGSLTLPPISLYTGLSGVLGMSMAVIPLLVARKYLAHPEDHVRLLLVLCIAAAGYSLLALYEIRMSPQLNRMFYGYFPQGWRQHLRGSGFRPIVFLDHGLELGIFFAATVLAAIGACRARIGTSPILFLGLAGWLLVTLVLSKTLGALLIILAFLPAILLLGVRGQLLFAAIFAGITLTYPMARNFDLVPTGRILAAVSMFSDRSASLQYRFINEDALLSKANERPIFGWGGWGRARVYSEDGGSSTTPDGTWVILFGEGGWVRYLSTFGLLTFPIMVLGIKRRSYDVTMATSALALALTANLVDLLPNSSLVPVTWLIAGALIGRLEVRAAAPGVAEEETAEAAPAQASPYRRNLPQNAEAPSPPPRLRRRAPASQLRRGTAQRSR